ncbi:TPA: hypothetical protein I9Z81_001228 [Clostridium perfringens]|nr:hypothetical protein KLF31_02200 [Clostridium perfringens]HAT4143104.1 hypothetical protein [Clostridium perfringens]HAT4146236.1 hypothetical protein [Clostridium perfringens]
MCTLIKNIIIIKKNIKLTIIGSSVFIVANSKIVRNVIIGNNVLIAPC